jgi:hypothetical protein
MCNALDKYAKPYVKYRKPTVNLIFNSMLSVYTLLNIQKFHTRVCNTHIYKRVLFYLRVDFSFGLNCHLTVMQKVLKIFKTVHPSDNYDTNTSLAWEPVAPMNQDEGLVSWAHFVRTRLRGQGCTNIYIRQISLIRYYYSAFQKYCIKNYKVSVRPGTW